MNEKIKGRRRFLGRMTGVAAAVGAALSGLVPELGVAAIPGGTPPTVDPTATPLPTLAPLSGTDLATQYSAALNNPDVALLVATLGEPGRIDPPTSSGAGGFGSGSTIQSIILPINSYASGATLAYVYFGDTTVVADDGSHYYQFRAMVTADGQVTLAGGGQVAPTPKPEWNQVLFASMFPDQYLATQVQVSLADTPTQRVAGGAAWNPFNLRKVAGGSWNPFNMRKVMAADQRGYTACVHNCTQTYNTCWNTGTNWGIAGLIMAIACIACIALNIAALTTTGPGGAAIVARACLVVCAIATSAVLQAIATLLQCSNNYKSCVASCKSTFLAT